MSALLMTRSAISRTKTANGSVVHFRSQQNTKIPGFSITLVRILSDQIVQGAKVCEKVSVGLECLWGGTRGHRFELQIC